MNRRGFLGALIGAPLAAPAMVKLHRGGWTSLGRRTIPKIRGLASITTDAPSIASLRIEVDTFEIERTIDRIKGLERMTIGAPTGDPVTYFSTDECRCPQCTAPAQPLHPLQAITDGAFTDANDRRVKPGDVVEHVGGRRGVLREVMQDGDAAVHFFDGHGHEWVKFKQLCKVPSSHHTMQQVDDAPSIVPAPSYCTPSLATYCKGNVDKCLSCPERTFRDALKIYVAGPMRGIPEFNFPAFDAATVKLRAAGHTVFNPAEKDNERHGTDISKGNATGDEAIASAQHGFNLREALGADLAYICAEADAIALLPGWEKSKGATAEHATAVALGLKVILL